MTPWNRQPEGGGEDGERWRERGGGEDKWRAGDSDDSLKGDADAGDEWKRHGSTLPEEPPHPLVDGSDTFDCVLGLDRQTRVNDENLSSPPPSDTGVPRAGAPTPGREVPPP
ncbi:hypothetical protein BGW80DRAFT_1303007 [Lactifluus volemus]|nr:hypothetical protein BGW80DRAFT_1303007 [Lactifluus volemus]